MKQATSLYNVFGLSLVFACGGLRLPLVQAQTTHRNAPTALQAPTGTKTAETLVALETLVAALQQRVNALETKLAPVHVLADPMNGLPGPHWILEGVNVHIRSGSGQTSDGCNDSPGGQTSTTCPTITGLGNLIIGYNEEPSGGVGAGERGGSHNLVSGSGHRLQSFGGLLAGQDNTVSGAYASVSGGANNTASGEAASVSGGENNRANGAYTSVSGGVNNTASGEAASVSGGENNRASNASASVSGGVSNTASALAASVSGGVNNRAISYSASVSGGVSNTASGPYASISGGESNLASETATSVSGGINRMAIGPFDWAAGSLFQDE